MKKTTKSSKGKTPSSERAKGVRIPTGDHKAVATGATEPTNLAPSIKKLLSRITKAGANGVAVSVAKTPYTRWLLRCLIKARLVRVVTVAAAKPEGGQP